MLLTALFPLKLVLGCRDTVPQPIAGQRHFFLVVGWSRGEAQVHCLPVEPSCIPDHVLIGIQEA